MFYCKILDKDGLPQPELNFHRLIWIKILFHRSCHLVALSHRNESCDLLQGIA
jgi:hypothetical protein